MRPRAGAALRFRARRRARGEQKLRELLGGNEIIVEPHGLDKYGRTLARLWLSDGQPDRRRYGRPGGQACLAESLRR